jgi:transposase
MEKKWGINLTPKERTKLLAIVSKGRNKAAVIRRAHILLKSDEGKTDRQIMELLYISEETVRRTRQRFCEEGLTAALEDRLHPERESKLGEAGETYLIALACTNPPPGRDSWTLELLAERLVADGIVESIAPETVRLVLKKTGSNPGR